MVNVSSLLHRHGIIDFDHLSTGPQPTQVSGRLPPAYCNSKLCNIYHAMELGKRAGEHGVEVYTLCPGWCYSGLMRHYHFPWYKYLTVIPIAFLFMRSANKVFFSLACFRLFYFLINFHSSKLNHCFAFLREPSALFTVLWRRTFLEIMAHLDFTATVDHSYLQCHLILKLPPSCGTTVKI